MIFDDDHLAVRWSPANWVHDTKAGEALSSPERRVGAEQMEFSRLKAELARMKMERDKLK